MTRLEQPRAGDQAGEPAADAHDSPVIGQRLALDSGQIRVDRVIG